MQRYQGRIVAWDDSLGSGIVVAHESADRTFLPAAAFGRSQRRPAVGDRITYEVELDEQRRPRAARAAFATRHANRPRDAEFHRRRHRRLLAVALALLLVLLAVLAVG